MSPPTVPPPVSDTGKAQVPVDSLDAKIPSVNNAATTIPASLLEVEEVHVDLLECMITDLEAITVTPSPQMNPGRDLLPDSPESPASLSKQLSTLQYTNNRLNVLVDDLQRALEESTKTRRALS